MRQLRRLWTVGSVGLVRLVSAIGARFGDPAAGSGEAQLVLRGVTLEHANAMARKYLSVDRATVVTAGPYRRDATSALP